MISSIKDLASAARCINEQDWGTERQIKAQNAFFDAVEKIVSKQTFSELEGYCMKANVDEMINEGLRVCQHAMAVKREFSDYDTTTLPPIPRSWTDQSWHNDACPSFNTETGMVVWVNYADPKDREIGELKRFIVQDDPNVINSNDVLLETDDWEEVLVFVAARSMRGHA